MSKWSSAAATVKGQVADTFRSLRHRNFLFYCLGIMASLTGSWMQSVAIGWVAFKLTGSTLVLGTVAFTTLVPTLVLSLAGGWAAEKFNRKKILLVTQSLALLQAVSLLVLTATNTVAVWHLLVLSSMLGSLVAFELPARFAMIPELVDKDEVLNAFSLDSFLFYTARAGGPAVGGLLLGSFGAAVCFGVNVVSYILELVTLLLIRYQPQPKQNQTVSIKRAFGFFLSHPLIRQVMILVAGTSFLAVYLAFMPAFVSTVLHRGETALGILVAASEVGALIASLWLAGQKDGAALKKALGYSGLALAVFLCAFGLTGSLWACALLLLLVGFFLTVVVMGGHGLVQLAGSNDMRGMISSIFWMSVLGLQSLGGLALGWAAQHWSLPVVLAISGAMCALFALVYVALTRNRDATER